jgi:uncharacterized membrane protein
MYRSSRSGRSRVHPVLIVFPLALFGMAFLFDLVGIASQGTLWPALAYWNLGAGIVTAVLAGAFGAADYAAIPSGTRASRAGLIHGLMQTCALGLFAVSFVIRTLNRSPRMQSWAIASSAAALCVSLVAGWIGAQLMDHLGTADADPLSFESAAERRDLSRT